MGQTPYGNNPEVFAPEIISIDGSIEKSIAISPRGDEIFFMRGSGWPHSKIAHAGRTQRVQAIAGRLRKHP